MLRAGLHDAVVAPRRLDHRAAFADIVRERLFDVDVFASLAGEHRDGGVPVVGRGDMNGVDVFPLQQPPEILIRLRLRTGPFFRTLGVRKIHIGHRAILHAGRFAHQTRYIPPAAAATDQADGDAVISAADPLSRESRRGGATKELTSLHVAIIAPYFIQRAIPSWLLLEPTHSVTLTSGGKLKSLRSGFCWASLAASGT